MKRQNKTVLYLLVGFLVIAGAFVIIRATNNSESIADDSRTVSTSQLSTLDKADTATEETVATPSAPTTEDLLLYLIEEEKLAHDVYVVMFQKYGANVFGNILESETTHQERVLTLLQARNISDPRSTELGVFKDQQLQALYNQLIEQGNISVTEAYKVGVAIEEKDIADISAQLATATDEDVVSTLEFLRSASENHLRAFNRQL
jgi:hypothetical protein